MKHLLLLFFLLPLACLAQNLVPNPSFEDTIACPQLTDQVSKSTWWSSYGNSPDYFHACHSGGLNVPNASFGFQYAQEGVAFVGLIPFNLINDTSYREYVGVQLLDTLEPGRAYTVSFYANCANLETYRFAINNIGALFSTVAYSSGAAVQIQNFAHVVSSEVISDTSGWTLVSQTIVADSSYHYLILGNFFSNALTDTLDIGNFNPRSYYYIDNVCVVEEGGDCLLKLSDDMHNDVNPGLTVYPNPTNDKISIEYHIGRIGFISLHNAFEISVRSSNALGESTAQMQMGNLPAGIYILKIETNNGNLTKLISKTN